MAVALEAGAAAEAEVAEALVVAGQLLDPPKAVAAAVAAD
jgi:hypothetical protein